MCCFILQVIDYVNKNETTIVANGNGTLHNTLKHNRDLSIASYSFLHTFYCDQPMSASEWGVAAKNIRVFFREREFIKKYEMALFQEFYRMEFLEYPRRVKTIYRPELIKYPGIHFPNEMHPASLSVVVDTSVGFLAHHRRTSEQGYFEIIVPPFYDKYFYAFKKSVKEFEISTNISSISKATINRRLNLTDRMK